MHAHSGGPITGIGYGLKESYFSFAPNGSSNPSASSIVGPLARYVTSITYSATGVQTIVFNSDFVFAQTPRFFISATAASLATRFDVQQIGAYNATTRTLVIQQAIGTTGNEVAASSGAIITVGLLVQDTTGK